MTNAILLYHKSGRKTEIAPPKKPKHPKNKQKNPKPKQQNPKTIIGKKEKGKKYLGHSE